MSRLSSAIVALCSRIKAADHIFVIRLTFAIILAWYLSYYFQLDKPYWPMMTVCIVSLPSPGSSIIKLLARLIGTTIGVTAITPIVYLSQYDPWLMSLMIALWVAVCHYICCCYYGSVSYCFALSGYTSALIGFATVSSPSSYTLFFVSQARFIEITMGLFIVFIVSYIFPSNKDQKLLKNAEQQSHKSLIDILEQDIINTSPPQKNIQKITSFILQIMNIKLLATQYIFSASNSCDRGLHAVSSIYQSLNTLGSLMLLKITKEELFSRNQNINEILAKRENNLEQSINNQDLKIPSSHPSESIYVDDFYKEFDKTTAAIINPKTKVINADEEKLLFIRGYHDQTEAIYNGLRTFLTIVCGVFFWLHGNWEYGYIGVILLAIACCYLSMVPMIQIAILFAGVGLIIGIIVAYTLKFGIFIGFSDFTPAAITFAFVMVILCYIQIIFSPIWALFSFVMMQVIIFSINFQNPMEYDFASFSNISLMLLFSFLIIMGIIYILPPSPTPSIINRMEKGITRKFNQYLYQKATYTQFKNYLATAINESKFIMDQERKSVLIDHCLRKFLIAYIIDNSGCSFLSQPKIIEALTKKDYQQVIQASSNLIKHAANDKDKLFWWQLRCVLKNVCDS